MATKIQWTEATMNPLKVILTQGKDDSPIVVMPGDPPLQHQGWACRKISPGCINCYAESLNLSEWPPGQGVNLPYTMGSFSHLRPVLRRDLLAKMRSWRKPKMVFPVDMSDIFLSVARCRSCARVWEDESEPSNCPKCGSTDLVAFWPSGWIQELLDVFAVAARSGSVVQILTKRVRRASRELSIWRDKNGRLPAGIRLGFSAEDQATFDERYAAARHWWQYSDGLTWVSAEPLLSGINFSSALGNFNGALQWGVIGGESLRTKALVCSGCSAVNPPLVAGRYHDAGEGRCGPVEARLPRPFHASWLRKAIDQFRLSGTPLFVKQLGGNFIEDEHRRRASFGRQLALTEDRASRRILLNHPKGGDIHEWPTPLRVRQQPEKESSR